MPQQKQYFPKFISQPNGRRFAIGDIHGCYNSLKGLIDQINLRENDQLFLLGDYISRGHHNAKVLDFIIALKNTYPRIYTLRGNHEEKLLLAYQQGIDFFEYYLEECNSLDLLNENLYDYLSFCDELAYCIITECHFLSHCGITKNSRMSFNDVRKMFPHVNIEIQDDIINNHYIIHGHNATSLTDIEKSIREKHKVINLDSGCVYKEIAELGYLCALDLDSFILYKQKNID